MMYNLFNLYMDDVRPCPVGWTVARTIDHAKELLKSGFVDACSLDHDMGACEECHAAGFDIGDMETPWTTFMYWCPHAMDGTKLVRWMAETGNWPKQKPVVHSSNPQGWARMRGLIDTYFGQPPLGPMFPYGEQA